MFDPDEAKIRVDVLNLAVRVHASGLQDDGKTVIETARDLQSFVEGEDYPA